MATKAARVAGQGDSRSLCGFTCKRKLTVSGFSDSDSRSIPSERRASETLASAATWASIPARSIAALKLEPQTAPLGKVKGYQHITGAGPGRDPRNEIPVVVVRRRAAKTVFAATHEMAR